MQPVQQDEYADFSQYMDPVVDQPKDQYADFAQYMDQPAQPEQQQRPTDYGEQFAAGMRESVAGEAAYATGMTDAHAAQEDPTFWGGLVREGSKMISDLLFMAAGATLGGALGATLGPLGMAGGAAFGAMAIPEFLKTSLKEYNDFQDRGGDVTFGEYLESAGRISNSTLRAGSMGMVLGAVNKAMPMLRQIPGLNKLFDTKYVGKAIEKGTGVAGEVAAATVVPAASEGRMPTAEDVGKAAVLFGGMHAAGELPRIVSKVPEQLSAVKDKFAPSPLNVALADALDKSNLAYPNVYEMGNREYTLSQNNKALIDNINDFDPSYYGEFARKVDDISDTSFASADAAGRAFQDAVRPLSEPTSRVEDAGITVPAQEQAKTSLAGRGTEAPTDAATLGVVGIEPQLFPENQPADQPGVVQIQAEPEPIPKPLRAAPMPMTPAQNPVNQAITGIADTAYATDTQAGEAVHREFHAVREREYATLNDRYTEQTHAAQGIAYVDERFVHEVEAFIREHGTSAAPNSPEAETIRAARRLRDLIGVVDEEGNISGARETELNRVMDTIKSLKKVPNWDMPGDFRKLLGEVIDHGNASIERHLEAVDENMATEFRQLNRDYRNFKQTFDNKATRVFSDPTYKHAAIGAKISKADMFRQVRDVLVRSPEGQRVLNRVRRTNWNNHFADGVLRATNEAEFVEGMTRVKPKELSTLMEMLEPQQRNQVLRTLQRSNELRQNVNRAQLEYDTAVRNYEQLKENRATEMTRIRNETKLASDQNKLNTAYDKSIKKAYEIKQQKLKENHAAFDRFKKAKVKNLRNIADPSETVRANKDMLSAMLRQDPAKLITGMETLQDIRNMKKVLFKTPGGTELFKGIAKYATEQMFSFVKEAELSSKRVPYDKIKIQMANKEFRARLEALNGPEFVKSMDELVEVADQLTQKFKTMPTEYIKERASIRTVAGWLTAAGFTLHSPVLSSVGWGGYAAKKAYKFWNDRNSYTQKSIRKYIHDAKAILNHDTAELRKMGHENTQKQIEEYQRKPTRAKK